MTEYERLLDAVRARRQTRRQTCGCASDAVASAVIAFVCFVTLLLIAIGGYYAR